MKKLNILELHRTLNDINNKHYACFEKILDSCHKRMIACTKCKKLNCFFEVPLYVIGYPIFDIGKCIEYLKKSLEADGFLVKYFFPKFLYISWDFDEIKKENEKNIHEVLKLENNHNKYLMNQKSKSLLEFTSTDSKGKRHLNLF